MFFSGTTLKKFKQKSFRAFNLALVRLKLKYGFKTVDAPFRLDLKLLNNKKEQKYSLERNSKLYIFRLLKIVRRYFGNVKQKYFRNVRKTSLLKSKGTALFNALLLLESRLDVFLVRCHLFKTLLEAKLFIQNGWVTVNQKIVYNFRFVVLISDVVSIFSKKLDIFKIYLLTAFRDLIHQDFKVFEKIFPYYIEFDLYSFNFSGILTLFSRFAVSTELTWDVEVLTNFGRFGF